MYLLWISAFFFYLGEVAEWGGGGKVCDVDVWWKTVQGEDGGTIEVQRRSRSQGGRNEQVNE